MKPHLLVGALSLALAACAPARTTVVTPAPAPVSAPPVATPTPPPAAPRAALTEAPLDWHLLDEAADGVPGISAERAMRELLAGRAPARTVVVAVIDGGTDTAHVDLRANLWSNAREVAGNGRDDDGNGYVDDVRGWSFIGGPTGDVHHDTYEITREYVRCTTGPAAARPAADRCAAIEREFNERRAEAESQLPQYRNMSMVVDQAVATLRRALGGDSLSVGRVTALQPANSEVQRARQLYLQLAASGITPRDVTEARASFESQVQYGYNPEYNPRGIVGDDPTNLAERRYGNANVTGPDASHGTHVAGIIGAVRGNGQGIDGIAPNVRLMILRAVPDGDERDKDVANAIRYAADNGAHIINMSFGKSHSPGKAAVDAAVKYAESKGVLLVHAAGNEGEDLSTAPNFPTPRYADGGRPANWIEVGASSWKGADSIVAVFSNYARDFVDVFAPGVDIHSALPGSTYGRQSGTSMAAPVVSGLAAMLMSYFPNLTAADVKRVILASATKRADQRVMLPGSGQLVPFGSLSATGGIVNAYAAVKMAQELSTLKQ